MGVLDLEGFDGGDREREVIQGRCLVFGLVFGDVLLFNVRYVDLVRGECVDVFMRGLERSLEFLDVGSGRRRLVVVVRDWEEEEVGSEELEKFGRELFEEEYGKVGKGDGLVGTCFEDLFEVRFVFLKHFRLCEKEFGEGVEVLREVVGEVCGDGRRGGKEVREVGEKVWMSLKEGDGEVAPEEKEVQASFACDKIMERVYEQHKERSSQWRTMINRGRIIRNFGTEVEKKINEALKVYERDAAAYESTSAFSRKRGELRELALGDAYILYSKQLGRLKDSVHDLFRNKLSRTRISSNVEKNVNINIKECEKYFNEQADSLRCKSSSWRFDRERKSLVDRMRDGATERLQMARIQGNYVPPIRAPIAVAFHTLLPAPFGQDARAPRPVQPDFPKPDKDRLFRPGRTRFRPHQVGRKVHPKGQYDFEDINEFSYIFEDAESVQ